MKGASDMEKVNLNQKFGLFTECWSPKIVGDLNDAYVKVAKFKGEFTWHKHDGEDEFFYVVNGSVTIRLRDKDVVLNPGEFLIVPKGIEHCPKADEEAHIMLLEPKTTLNTGDVVNEKTVAELDWI